MAKQVIRTNSVLNAGEIKDVDATGLLVQIPSLPHRHCIYSKENKLLFGFFLTGPILRSELGIKVLYVFVVAFRNFRMISPFIIRQLGSATE